jgi:predicted Zn-dependent protease
MHAAARIVVAVPALVALVWAGLLAARLGSTESAAFSTGRGMASWQAHPGDESLGRMKADLDQAVSRAPKDPALQEMLGRVALAGPRQDGATDVAIMRFTNAARLRPTSPYSWANLAEALYRKGDTGPLFEQALQRAAETGPWEPEVQRSVANYGLAVWGEVSPQTRAAIDQMVANGMVRNAPEILQISARRGRLGVACAHLARSKPTDPKWTRNCP